MPPDGGTTAAPRTGRPRADATRNRQRIISAAREAMVEFGPETPLDEVARRAGVGNATLYRHFADRAELIRQVTLTVMAGTTRRAEVALAEEPDAFSALRRFVFEAAQERIGVLCPIVWDAFGPRDPALVDGALRLEAAIGAIMERARLAGLLRGDVSVGDLLVAVTQLTRPLPGAGCVDFDRFVHRHLQLFLDGLRAPAASVLVDACAEPGDPNPEERR